MLQIFERVISQLVPARSFAHDARLASKPPQLRLLSACISRELLRRNVRRALRDAEDRDVASGGQVAADPARAL